MERCGRQVLRASTRSLDILSAGYSTPGDFGYARIQSTSLAARALPTLPRRLLIAHSPNQ